MARIKLDGGINVRTFAPPPRGFDPITASPADLAKHGFPTRPDHPEHLERFKRVFGQMKGRLHYIEPTFRVNPEIRHGPAASRHFDGKVGVKPPVTGIGNQFSTIWSGALVFPAPGQTFRWIVGEWTIPNVSSPDDGQTYYCATWIGIDGDSSVPSRDLCQAGINMDVTQSGGAFTRNCSAWCEWFPGPELPIANFLVTFGDTVAITICTTGAGSTEALIFFANLTSGLATSFLLPAGTFPDGNQISLVGDSAQWVVERPEVGGTTALLANYTELFFSGCQAVSYSADGALSEVSSGGTEIHIDMLPVGASFPSGILSHGILVADTVVQCVFVAPGTGH
jgi:peptidase A4-like protein